MSRRPYFYLGAGIIGLLAFVAAARFGGEATPFYLTSYLAAWLFVLAAPLGALPLVAVHDLTAGLENPVSATLRTLLVGMPVAAVLAIPILVNFGSLYPATHGAGFAAVWVSDRFRLGRSVGYLIALVALALSLIREPAPQSTARRSLAGFVLACYLVLGALSAGDWIGAVELGLNSSELGLLVLVAQAGVALSLAALVVARKGYALPADLAPTLLTLLAAWLFLQFTQYLVVWSADLPGEAAWYILRNSGFGQITELAAVAACALAAGLLGWRARRRAIALAAALIVLIHYVEALWLVTPAQRGAFTFTFTDGLAILGLGGVLTGGVTLARRLLPIREFEPVPDAPVAPRADRGRRLSGLVSRASVRPRHVSAAAGRGHPETLPRPQALEEAYEPQDANARDLAVIMIVGAGSIAVSIAGLFVLLGYFQSRDRPPAPLTPEERATIVAPGPPLQSDPLTDIARLRSQEMAKLQGYRWLSRGQTAQIPIDRAMALMIGKSLDPAPAPRQEPQP